MDIPFTIDFILKLFYSMLGEYSKRTRVLIKMWCLRSNLDDSNRESASDQSVLFTRSNGKFYRHLLRLARAIVNDGRMEVVEMLILRWM